MGTSRHLPKMVMVPPGTKVQRWFAPPLHSQITGRVAVAVALVETSRNRPEALTSVVARTGAS